MTKSRYETSFIHATRRPNYDQRENAFRSILIQTLTAVSEGPEAGLPEALDIPAPKKNASRLINPLFESYLHIFLNEIDRLAKARVDFAFETSLSGLVHLARLRRWKAAGYRIEIIFLRLSSPRVALRRIAARVKQGGHDVPRADVLRRFTRGWANFQSAYRPLADAWAVYNNSGQGPRLQEKSP